MLGANELPLRQVFRPRQKRLYGAKAPPRRAGPKSCQHHEKKDNWTHRTFQGTVTSIETVEEGTIIAVISSGADTEKKFIVNDHTIYTIGVQVGDEVVVESDYNMREHNGDNVPFPATMITDPSITDEQ